MTPQEVMDGIYLIKIPLPNNPLRNLNSYLIIGEERHMLVDTGFRSRVCYDALREGLDPLNIKIDDLDIFLTHSHYDHAGLASWIASDRTPVYVGDIDGRGLRRYNNPINRDSRSMMFLNSGFPQAIVEGLRLGAPDASLHPTEMECVSVRDGHVFTVGHYNLRCIHTPGHTPGHMCLYDDATQTLISGDHVLFDITPNVTTWMGLDDALGAFMDSLRLIKTLDVKATFCAHRDPSGDCKGRIDEMLAHHETRLDEVRGIVEKFRRISPYDTAEHMTWSIRAASWDEVSAHQKIFAVGEAACHLEYLRLRKELRREISPDGIYLYSMY